MMKNLNTARLFIACLFAVSVAAEDYVGQGILNVVSQNNKKLGCLNDVMSYVTDTSECAIFTGNKTITYEYGYESISRSFETSAGPCGDPFLTGSQYQEGGNRILLCGAGSDSDNSFWTLSNGVNGLIGIVLLEAANDDSVVFVPVKGSTGVLQQDLVGSKNQLSLTWTAQ